MGLRCSIRCARCGRNILIREGGFNKKKNKDIECPYCGYKNSALRKKNGKILIV